jgi:hypothetical protein
MRHASRWHADRNQADVFFHELMEGALSEAEAESYGDAAEQLPAGQGQDTWCCKRHSISAVARVEDMHWTNPANNARLLESAASQRPFLVRYWMATGLGAAAAANAAAQSAVDHVDFPWSAAFICFVMRAAGVTQADGFNFGSAHMSYIVGALRNRERSTPNSRFWLVDSIEIRNEAIPEPGDLICFNRPVPGGGMTTHSYTSLRTQFWGNNGQNQNVAPTGSSHCALVVGRTGTPGFLETIGGNETNSVRLQRTVAIDANGGIPNAAAHANPGPIFGMIKMMRC